MCAKAVAHKVCHAKALALTRGVKWDELDEVG